MSSLSETTVTRYNAPGICGIILGPALVGRPAAHPNIGGLLAAERLLP